MNTPLLEIENLKVEIGNERILHGVNLTIEEGTVHVIFGPNGSGKTTLVGAIMGLPQYRVTDGDIKFKGESIGVFNHGRAHPHIYCCRDQQIRKRPDIPAGAAPAERGCEGGLG